MTMPQRSEGGGTRRGEKVQEVNATVFRKASFQLHVGRLIKNAGFSY